MKIEKAGNHQVYLVDNAIQSVFPPTPKGFWNEMVPEGEVDSALILGLGAGTLAKLLLDKYGLIDITGVDSSQDMIYQSVENLRPVKIKTVCQDAFAYVEKCEKKYDYIGVDLYDGTNFPVKVLQEEFIQRVKYLLNPRGVAVFNIPNLDKLIKGNAPKARVKEYNVNLLLTLKSAIVEAN